VLSGRELPGFRLCSRQETLGVETTGALEQQPLRCRREVILRVNSMEETSCIFAGIVKGEEECNESSSKFSYDVAIMNVASCILSPVVENTITSTIAIVNPMIALRTSCALGLHH
jgi:hypothetical protein